MGVSRRALLARSLEVQGSPRGYREIAPVRDLSTAPGIPPGDSRCYSPVQNFPRTLQAAAKTYFREMSRHRLVTSALSPPASPVPPRYDSQRSLREMPSRDRVASRKRA